ncbi:MAG: prepilin peptidase, partial [Candidatus Adiutrix sp.]|nr:prepilin peptidase [Candidatus Adiutrix sp.]
MSISGPALKFEDEPALGNEPSAGLPPEFWPSAGRRTRPEDLPKGLDALWHRAQGRLKNRQYRTAVFMRQAEAVLALESGFSRNSDGELRERAAELRVVFQLGKGTPADTIRAAAVIREASLRVFGFRHHKEQIAGALALTCGCIAEMATGEGKTLTAAIPAILAAWRAKGCHVLTVNDYLAQRDAEEMGRLYGFFGLSALALTQEASPAERRRAYAADLTYLTNKEAAADYLRDRLALGPVSGLPAALLGALSGQRGGERMVQRGLEYAIVDEADSVLVDEAVTPLLISGDAPNAAETEAYVTAHELSTKLQAGEHYKIDLKLKEITLTKAGESLLAQAAESLPGFWQGRRRREEMVSQALNAKTFFRLGHEFVIDDGKVVIVDESTGRLMPDRSWRGGLHQAVEVKEGLEPTPNKATFARLSFQRFFRLYKNLSGLTGTGREAGREFWQIYQRPVTAIPTHRPCLRKDEPVRVFRTKADKWREAAAEIERVHALGRPVLVGTRSIQDSEDLSALLGDLPHQVLNAVHHAEEAEIVKRAGREKSVTVATNMAGRGTDIKLTPGAAGLGGLHVLSAERNLSPRIDRQLYGRGARQGDPGGAAAVVSLEDELVRRFCPWLTALAVKCIRAGDDGRLPGWLVRLFAFAAWKAERQALSQRKQVLEAD